jgi:O-antigen/teichoic acid export membrane protein
MLIRGATRETFAGFLSKNSLFSNAINLMLSAGVTALFGFVFWTIVARSFDPDTVGLATTLLSMSALLSLLGLVGFDTVFVRFLPKSKQPSDEINNGMLVSGIASGLIAAIFCAIIPFVSPKLSFVNQNTLYIVAFIVFTIFTTWNTLTNAVLIAYRRTSFVIIINILFSALKMCLPFLIHSGGPMTIFTFTGIAQVVNVLISIAIIVKVFNYRPALRIHTKQLAEVRRYGSAVYFAQVLNLLPDSCLPLIVVNRLGAAAAAFFYIALTIANLLYTIAFSTAQALLAEASHDEENLANHIKSGFKFATALILPPIIILFIFCPFVLGLFGPDYKEGATTVLRILSIAGIGVVFGALMNFVFKQTKNLKAMLITSATNAVATVVLSLVLVGPLGLPGIGWAFIVSAVLSLIVGGYFMYRTFNVTTLKYMLKW